MLITLKCNMSFTDRKPLKYGDEVDLPNIVSYKLIKKGDAEPKDWFEYISYKGKYDYAHPGTTWEIGGDCPNGQEFQLSIPNDISEEFKLEEYKDNSTEMEMAIETAYIEVMNKEKAIVNKRGKKKCL